MTTMNRQFHLLARFESFEKSAAGAMGIVYEAEQPEPQRRVALKVVKSTRPSEQIVARFRAERQAIAMMEHPGIATLFEVGLTDDNRPYFALEFVDGLPITKYCDANRLSIDARLRLFAKTCRGIQHAHQKGIIHRDIKPSNVLALREGDEHGVRIIDFGLAKAVLPETHINDETLVTEPGRLLGTLGYLSPEHAACRGTVETDTRSDVYSLGALLFELLTGDTPIPREVLASSPLDTILGTIRLEDAPRLGAVPSLAKTDSAIADARDTTPGQLRRQLKGELGWIAAKALARDPSDRYDSANALADDIDRYLEDEPIQARPPTVGYRLGKFFSRHRSRLGFIVLAAIAAVAIGAAINGYAESETLNREIRLRQAVTRGHDGDWVAAINELNNLEPDGSLEVSLKLLDAHFAQGEHEQCWEILDQAQKKWPTNGSLLLWEAEHSMRHLKPHETSVQLVNDALQSTLPADEKAYAEGLIADSSEAAIRQFEVALAINRFNQRAILQLASIHVLMGNTEPASELLADAEEKFPDATGVKVLSHYQRVAAGDTAPDGGNPWTDQSDDVRSYLNAIEKLLRALPFPDSGQNLEVYSFIDNWLLGLRPGVEDITTAAATLRDKGNEAPFPLPLPIQKPVTACYQGLLSLYAENIPQVLDVADDLDGFPDATAHYILGVVRVIVAMRETDIEAQQPQVAMAGQDFQLAIDGRSVTRLHRHALYAKAMLLGLRLPSLPEAERPRADEEAAELVRKLFVSGPIPQKEASDLAGVAIAAKDTDLALLLIAASGCKGEALDAHCESLARSLGQPVEAIRKLVEFVQSTNADSKPTNGSN